MVQALFLHTDTLRPIVSLDLDFSALTYTKVKAFPIGLKFPVRKLNFVLPWT